MPEATFETRLVASGVPGLDGVLAGGFAENRIHLVEGPPGSGKTTLGLQFLIAGAARSERGLYFTLSESKNELLVAAEAHGWSLDGIDILELVPPELSLDPKQQQTVLYSADLELGETLQAVIDQVDALKPQRIVFDSLSEIRLLAQSSLRYRRQVLGLKHYFAQNACTVLLLDDQGADGGDQNLHTVSHSVLCLEHLAMQYGAERRRLRVLKIRAPASGAASTISRSARRVWLSTRAWLPPSTTGRSTIQRQRPLALRNLTLSLAAASTGARAR
jgi:circadian clock protein KaiC